MSIIRVSIIRVSIIRVSIRYSVNSGMLYGGLKQERLSKELTDAIYVFRKGERWEA